MGKREVGCHMKSRILGNSRARALGKQKEEKIDKYNSRVYSRSKMTTN